MKKKLYQLNYQERQNHVLSKYQLTSLDYALSDEAMEHMIENSFTKIETPIGLVQNVTINHKVYDVPLATEEPSVIAANNKANSIISKNGGFVAHIQEHLIRAQIAFTDLEPGIIKKIKNEKNHLISIAHEAHPSILKRGGGVHDIIFTKKEEFFIIYLLINTQEAMGANIANNMAEACKVYLEQNYSITATMAILSNLATESMVYAECTINPKSLDYSDEIIQRFTQASRLAQVDAYRAATHNKGIMNGIDALMLATGNDYRAVEASCHAYASINGYKGLSIWEEKDHKLHGSIYIPLRVATVGGTINLNPCAKTNLKIMGNPNSKELMKITACIGLAQNFAALYALVTDGIQKGHMSLQAKSLAIRIGATGGLVNIVANRMVKEQDISEGNARYILRELTIK